MSAFVRYVGRHHIALLALFVALGGTSYAASLAANSVGSKQIKTDAVTASEIKKDAVTSSEIKTGAVTSSEVKDGSLQALDFAAGQLPHGPQGPQGPQGIPGAVGPTGPGAPPAVQVGVQTVRSPAQTVPPGGFTSNMRADCPPNTVVVGTGFNSNIGNADFVLSFGTFVGGFVHNDVNVDIQPYVQAICGSGVNNFGGAASSAEAAESFKLLELNAQATHQ